MSQTKLEQYIQACNYPGRLDVAEVEKQLAQYLMMFKIDRRIVRLESGWTLAQHPSLQRSVYAILDRLRSAVTKFDAQDAQAARAARDAQDAVAAQAARATGAAWAAQAARDAVDAQAARDAQDAVAAQAARAARAAWDAQAARDAVAARAAWDAQAARAIHSFASWCIQAGGWWYWSWELSWIATTFFGAVQLKKPHVQQWALPLLEAYLNGAWILYWTDDTLFWVAKPTLHKDPAPGTRRLHHETSAALESDVENLFFWHGVLVPEYIVVRPDSITVEQIETETNAEVRRVMIERMGQWRYLQESGATLVHTDSRGALYRKEIPNDEPLVMVKVKNATQEPDGSYKDYFLRVPPTITMAAQAVAWTFGFSKVEEYAPSIET